jgi:hypothetical protein
MRKTVILALFTSGVLAAGVAIFTPGNAQPAPPPPPPPGDMQHGPGRDAGMRRPGGYGDRMRGAMDRRGGWMQRMRQYALVYPARDRALTGADVQKIAESYLLLNGNHTWKVTEVVEQPDTVLFAFATPDGDAIAHFSMDRHTGRPTRVS